MKFAHRNDSSNNSIAPLSSAQFSSAQHRHMQIIERKCKKTETNPNWLWDFKIFRLVFIKNCKSRERELARKCEQYHLILAIYIIHVGSISWSTCIWMNEWMISMWILLCVTVLLVPFFHPLWTLNAWIDVK